MKKGSSLILKPQPTREADLMIKQKDRSMKNQCNNTVINAMQRK